MPKILHWLLPKEEEFFRMLGEQASTAVEAVDDFSKLVYDYNILSDLKKKELVSKIEDLEDKGDNLTHKIIGDLDKTFITPIDKEDIHRLAMLLDDVIDLIHMASERMPTRGQNTKNNARTRKGRKKTVAGRKKAAIGE